ncbi:MAG TPA: hypothetical protein VFQ61_08075, partial [Polyangiaceae bacterium]|nr:hypothetical protein [Polyangiaceae bacterium]
VESARIYHAACLIGAGQPEKADEPLKAAIRANVQMRPPDSLVFPPPVIERFLRVRQTLYDEIKRAEARRVQEAREAAEARAARERAEAERVAELERLAAREVLVVKNRRFIAWIPFGAGQFQNGDEGLGWAFFTGELMLSATALTSLGFQTYLAREASQLRNEENNQVLRTWNAALNVSSYALIGVAAIGVLQAHLAFVPEVKQERVHPLPERLRRPHVPPAPTPVTIVPDVGFQSDRFTLGVTGRF